MGKHIGSLLLLAMLSACASNPPPVPVEGESRGLASLAGEWSGSYVGNESGRSGSIVFRLAAGADTAYGDVVMVPRHEERVRDESRADSPRPARIPLPIAISFVHAQADSVFGQLDDYRDPDCGCRLRTVFRGHLEADRIDGTFTTQHLEGGQRHGGTWHVERKR